jgi:hypothetical protein
LARCAFNTATIVAAALLRAAIATSIVKTAARLIAAILVSAARLVSALIALRRSIFRRRKIASASWRAAALTGASAATASTATSEASASAIATAIVAAAVAFTAASKILAAAIVSWAAITATRRILLRRIVLVTEILWSRSVRFRLPLFEFTVRLGVASAHFTGQRFDVGVTIVVSRARYIAVRIFVLQIVMLLVGVRIVVTRFTVFFVVGLIVTFVRFGTVRERLTRQNFGDHRRGRRSRGERMRIAVSMTMIVIFEIFENVADVQEGVAVQADVDEGRLHARKDAGDAAFVNTPDQREFLLALNINFD